MMTHWPADNLPFSISRQSVAACERLFALALAGYGGYFCYSVVPVISVVRFLRYYALTLLRVFRVFVPTCLCRYVVTFTTFVTCVKALRT